MPSISFKSVIGHSAPLLFIIVGMLLKPYLDPVIVEYRAILELLPYVLLIFATLLGFHFNVSRLFLGSVMLALCYALLQSGANTGSSSSLVQLLSVIVPSNIALLALLPERGVRSMFCYTLVGLLMAEGALSVALLNQVDNSFWTWFRASPVDWDIAQQLALSQLSLITVLVTSMLVLLCWLFMQGAFTWVLLVLLLGVSLVLNDASDFSLRLIVFGSLGAILLASLLWYSHNMAYRDELTGLMGRRALNEYLSRLGRRYVIAMLDVDRFKKFNDTYGHDTGDQVLRMVGAQLGKVSGGGKAFRYGGEEFAIVFPRKKLLQVKPHLEVIREMIADYPMKVRSTSRPKDIKEGRKLRRKNETNKEVRVTVSIGVAERTAPLKLAAQVIKAADQALYQAKRKGRNRVCCQ